MTGRKSLPLALNVPNDCKAFKKEYENYLKFFLYNFGEASMGLDARLITAVRFELPHRVKEYLQKGADINAVVCTGDNNILSTCVTPLMTASSPEMIDLLISLGANPNLICERKRMSDAPRTALESAIERADIKIIDYLINKGADVNLKAGRKTLLAFTLGHRFLRRAPELRKKFVKYLLEMGADPNEISFDK